MRNCMGFHPQTTSKHHHQQPMYRLLSSPAEWLGPNQCAGTCQNTPGTDRNRRVAAACAVSVVGSADDSLRNFLVDNLLVDNSQCLTQMGMDQYLLIPFLVGWTSIYQLFWCSPGVQGFDTLPNRSQRYWQIGIIPWNVGSRQEKSIRLKPQLDSWGLIWHLYIVGYDSATNQLANPKGHSSNIG